ncbi:MAG: hydrogenase iron-sulfur subunit, partial [Desulfobulbaceae bacterium]|nr:hydrogenase iron-sulfur subunit [Desulfobulbaceae bacterium]
MKPQIVIFCCANSTPVPEEHVGKVMSEQDVDLKLSRLPCSGRTDVLHILKAIEGGADMAMVVGCPEGRCQFLEGNVRAAMRVKFANKLLAEAGKGDERVR